MTPRQFKTGDVIGWSVVDWTGTPIIHRKARDAARKWKTKNRGKYEGMRLVRIVVAK